MLIFLFLSESRLTLQEIIVATGHLCILERVI